MVHELGLVSTVQLFMPRDSRIASILTAGFIGQYGTSYILAPLGICLLCTTYEQIRAANFRHNIFIC